MSLIECKRQSIGRRRQCRRALGGAHSIFGNAANARHWLNAHGTRPLDFGVGTLGIALNGLCQRFRQSVERSHPGGVAHQAGQPPSLVTVAIGECANHLPLGGNVRKRRQVYSQGQRLAAPPALSLIDEQDFEPIDRKKIRI